MIEFTKEPITFNYFDSVKGIDCNFFNYNEYNNNYFTRASTLGEYDDNNFIFDNTLYYKNGQLFMSRRNFYYGTFVLLKSGKRLFYTFEKRVTNEFSDKLIYRYIGGPDDPQALANQYRYSRIIVIAD